MRWSVSFISCLLVSCASFISGFFGEPPHRYQFLDRLLLAEIKLEEFIAHLAKTLHRSAVSDLPAHALELEQPVGGQRHNEARRVERRVETEEPIQASLHYYVAKVNPGVLAVARYHATDDEGRILAVAEDIFYDTAEDFCRVQDDVEESLYSGFDVHVMSPFEAEHFEGINRFLADGDDEEAMAT